MTINSKKTNIDDFAESLITDLRKGLYLMAEKAAANNESLVIGNIDGTSKSIPAKELLKTMSEVPRGNA